MLNRLGEPQPSRTGIYLIAGAGSLLWAGAVAAFAYGYISKSGFALAPLTVVFLTLLAIAPIGLILAGAYVVSQARSLAAEARRARRLTDELIGPTALAAAQTGAVVEAMRGQIATAVEVANQARDHLTRAAPGAGHGDRAAGRGHRARLAHRGRPGRDAEPRARRAQHAGADPRRPLRGGHRRHQPPGPHGGRGLRPRRDPAARGRGGAGGPRRRSRRRRRRGGRRLPRRHRGSRPPGRPAGDRQRRRRRPDARAGGRPHPSARRAGHRRPCAARRAGGLRHAWPRAAPRSSPSSSPRRRRSTSPTSTRPPVIGADRAQRADRRGAAASSASWPRRPAPSATPSPARPRAR